MKAASDPVVAAAAVAGIVACVGDLVIPAVLGRMVPGYDGTRDVLSRLGAADSPVRFWINSWWCVFGLLLLAFAWGFHRTFAPGGFLSWAGVATLLLVIFGLGAGPGAGLFPMDEPGRGPTLHGTLHHWLSGAGFAAVFFLPLISLGIFSLDRHPALFWISLAAQCGGVAAAWLIFAAQQPGTSGILAWGGMWQRVFLLNYYVYLGAIACVMLRANARG